MPVFTAQISLQSLPFSQDNTKTGSVVFIVAAWTVVRFTDLFFNLKSLATETNEK